MSGTRRTVPARPSLTVGSTRTPTLAMPSAFSWPVLVPYALRAPAPVNLGVRRSYILFGLFKKKTAPDARGAKANEVLSRSADMLKMQLMLCSAEPQKYQEFINSSSFSGYACGFFDATLQYAGLRPPEDPQVFALISLGFFHLFNKNQDEALRHSEKFLTEQDAAEFHNSRVLGGSEYFDFMDGKIKMPNGLARIFHQEN